MHSKGAAEAAPYINRSVTVTSVVPAVITPVVTAIVSPVVPAVTITAAGGTGWTITSAPVVKNIGHKKISFLFRVCRIEKE